MYAQAGLLDGRPAERPGVAVEDAIRADARLSEDQKETLLRVYRSFVERAGRSETRA